MISFLQGASNSTLQGGGLLFNEGKNDSDVSTEDKLHSTLKGMGACDDHFWVSSILFAPVYLILHTDLILTFCTSPLECSKYIK
jgi:hypothetical protein